MENNKQNATLFIYQWVDENVVPDDTGKLSDMLIAYGNKLNIPDVMQRSELLLDFVKWKNDKDKNWLKHIDEKEVGNFLKLSNSA